MPHTARISSDPASQRSAVALVASAPEGHVVTFERRMTLASDTVRSRALAVARALKAGWQVKVSKRNRSREQNDKMWAMLTDLSRAKPEGRKCTPDDWKCLVMHACGHDVQFMIGLDGKPFPVGFRSSHLTIGQMSDLIEWMIAYGAEHGVQWSDAEDPDAAPTDHPKAA